MSTASKLTKLAQGIDSNGVLSAEKGGTGTTSGGAATVVAATAPVSPQVGSFWLNSDTGDLHVYAGGSWILIGSSGAGSTSLPAQATNSGKFLTTDGTTASWGVVTTTPADGSITNAKLAAGAVTYDKVTVGTAAWQIASGTTAQRPEAPVAGHMRINTDTSYVELYNNNQWYNLQYIGVVAGSGGTTTTVGNYKVHTFTSTAGFTLTTAPTLGGQVEYFIVGGGGGSTGGVSGVNYGSGGAGGTVRTGTATLLPGTVYTVTIGAGGTTGGGNGGSSTITGANFTTLTATGGNGAGSGFAGGNNADFSGSADGGGGVGAGGGAGSNGAGVIKAGGPGVSINWSGSATYYGGGGGGGPDGTGGLGGGGSASGGNAAPGTTNTGGGASGGNASTGGSSGGSGIVILRYRYQ